MCEGVCVRGSIPGLHTSATLLIVHKLLKPKVWHIIRGERERERERESNLHALKNLTLGK